MTIEFFKQLFENALVAFVASLITFTGTDVTNISSVPWSLALKTSGGTALVVVMLGILASRRGDPNSTSFLKDSSGS